MKLILEYDDLHWQEPENCLKSINTLVKIYPDIKLSFFTIPNLRNFAISDDKAFCAAIRKYIDNNNICLGVHGFTHSAEEFKNLDYEEALDLLRRGEDIFKQADLSFRKIFRGPHWGMCENSIVALSHMQYTHLFNHEDYRHLDKFATDRGLKTRYYNWNLKNSEVDISKYFIIAHGHTHNVCENGIEESMSNVINFIDQYKNITEFNFIGDF